MIESITLMNFQSHEKTEVEFSSGLNVIVGSSDSGKTAVLRAFRLVSENRPSGDAMVSHWAKDTSGKRTKFLEEMHVMLCVDGKWITRRKGKENCYFLDDQKYEALGGKIPEDIGSLLNLDELSVQQQHDGVFLLSDSSGEVARKLNRVVNLDKIDVAMKFIDSKKRSTNQQIVGLKTDIESLEESVEGYSWISGAEKAVDQYERIGRDLSDLRKSFDDLNRMLKRYSDLQERVQDYSKIIGMANSAIESNNVVCGKKEAMIDLTDLLISRQGIVSRQIDYSKVIGMVNSALDLCNEKSELDSAQESLMYVYADVVSTRRKLKKVQDEVEHLDFKFQEEMPDICPLCGRSG